MGFVKFLTTASPALTAFTLILIAIISFTVRIFSVIKYESIIHEFDPWFNFRATKYLDAKGVKEFRYWFDSESWYPLGRFVGHTVFPGLMYTTVYIRKFLLMLGIPIDIKEICVFTAPLFSILTCLFGYQITKEINGRVETGLLAALLIAVIPSYLSRSMAGSYDNEAISISLLMISMYFFIRSIKTGDFIKASLSALFYCYLVASWGGYSFLIAFIPLFVLATLIAKKFNYKIYLAYSVFYIISCFWSIQTKFVEFKVWHKSEHLGSHLVFILIQIKVLFDYLQSNLKSEDFKKIIKFFIFCICSGIMLVIMYLGYTGKTAFSERVMTLLDPNYAKKFIPIIASVSEHQPSSWSSFFFDLHFTILLTPIGLYFTLKKTTNSKLFIALYFVTTVYFAAFMVRLILLLFPAMCILSAIGISEFLREIKENLFSEAMQKTQKLIKYV